MVYRDKIIDRQIGRNAELFALAVGEKQTKEERYPFVRILVSILEQARPEWTQSPLKDRQIAHIVFKMSRGAVPMDETAEIVRLRDMERGLIPLPERPEDAAAAAELEREAVADVAAAAAAEAEATAAADAPAADAANAVPAADEAVEAPPADAAYAVPVADAVVAEPAADAAYAEPGVDAVVAEPAADAAEPAADQVI